MTGQPRSVSRPKDVAAKATTQVSMSELDELDNPNDRREAYLQKVRPKP
jgi:hypothetical protein